MLARVKSTVLRLTLSQRSGEHVLAVSNVRVGSIERFETLGHVEQFHGRRRNGFGFRWVGLGQTDPDTIRVGDGCLEAIALGRCGQRYAGHSLHPHAGQKCWSVIPSDASANQRGNRREFAAKCGQAIPPERHILSSIHYLEPHVDQLSGRGKFKHTVRDMSPGH